MNKEKVISELNDLSNEYTNSVLPTKWYSDFSIGGTYFVDKTKYNAWHTKTLAFLKLFLSFDNEYLTKFSLLSKNSFSNAESANLIIKNVIEYIEKGFIVLNKIDDHNINEKNIQTKQYDVFISHASKDKIDYIEKLVSSIKKLNVNCFYDTDVISWGDNWKQKILKGTDNSEFAIIVISKNFFDGDWTNKELNEFMKKQNQSGQKVVLPLLYEVTINEMKDRYPFLSDIQALKSADLSCDEIAVLFAKELIKRLKGEQYR